jgi:hypothetical protein
MISDEDKQALALWMLDHPKDPKMKLRAYFEAFARHVSNLYTPVGHLTPVTFSNFRTFHFLYISLLQRNQL